MSPLSQSSDHRPSAQGNLMGSGAGGHAPAWHGGAPGPATAGAQAQNNTAALSGFKSKEFGGQGFNQLVFDDTPGQLRVQLASTQHASQLNLGHLIHQADNHRGSYRGQGFELRTDAYGAVRATQGLLITSYGATERDPAGDNAPGMALLTPGEPNSAERPWIEVSAQGMPKSSRFPSMNGKNPPSIDEAVSTVRTIAASLRLRPGALVEGAPVRDTLDGVR